MKKSPSTLRPYKSGEEITEKKNLKYIVTDSKKFIIGKYSWMLMKTWKGKWLKL